MFRKLKVWYADSLSEIRNSIKRRKVTNKKPIIVANDCGGGHIYKALHLEYRSPFMWLNISSEDFLGILENFDDFLNAKIEESREQSEKMGFPVGVVERPWGNVVIYFRHYPTFEDAINKWNRRLSRMDRELVRENYYHYITDNIGFMITEGYTDRDELLRFAKLPYPHKVAFISDEENMDVPNTFLLKKWPKDHVVMEAQNQITQRTYMDQFDYVKFINEL